MFAGMVLCECHSPGEDKLVLGCADGTLVSGLPCIITSLENQNVSSPNVEKRL